MPQAVLNNKDCPILSACQEALPTPLYPQHFFLLLALSLPTFQEDGCLLLLLALIVFPFYSALTISANLARPCAPQPNELKSHESDY